MVILSLNVIIVEEFYAKILNLLTTDVACDYEVVYISGTVHGCSIGRLHGNEREEMAGLRRNNNRCDENNNNTHNHSEQSCWSDFTVSNC